MTDSDKIKAVISILIEFMEIESLRDGNQDGPHSHYARLLERLNDPPPRQGGLNTGNTTLC